MQFKSIASFANKSTWVYIEITERTIFRMLLLLFLLRFRWRISRHIHSAVHPMHAQIHLAGTNSQKKFPSHRMTSVDAFQHRWL